MANKEIGINIRVKGRASTDIKKIGVSAKSANAAIKNLGTNAVILNQAMELGMRVFTLVRGAVTSLTSASEKFLPVGSRMRKWMKDSRRESELLQARIGDILIPLIVGLKGAVQQSNKTLSEWVGENRELIGTKIITWIHGTGQKIVTFLLPAVQAIVMAFFGWKLLVKQLQLGFLEFFSFLTVKLASGLRDLRSMFQAVAPQSVLDRMDDMAKSLAAFGAVGQESIKDTRKELAGMVVDMDAVNEKVAAVQKAARRGFGKFREIALAALADTSKGTKLTVNEQLAALDKLAARQRELAALAEAQASHLAGVLTASFAAMGAAAEQGGSLLEAVSKTAVSSSIDTANTIINTYLAQAIAGALAGHSAIPVVGLALGAAAAAVVSGLIKAQLNNFATGGQVTGGTPGRDSVPAMLMPGERVMTRSQNREASLAGGGGGTTINFNARVDALDIPSGPEKRKALIRLGHELEELVSDGMILRNVVRA